MSEIDYDFFNQCKDSLMKSTQLGIQYKYPNMRQGDPNDLECKKEEYKDSITRLLCGNQFKHDSFNFYIAYKDLESKEGIAKTINDCILLPIENTKSQLSNIYDITSSISELTNQTNNSTFIAVIVNIRVFHKNI
jgi:hypothetical protein